MGMRQPENKSMTCIIRYRQKLYGHVAFTRKLGNTSPRGSVCPLCTEGLTNKVLYLSPTLFRKQKYLHT